MKITRKDDGKRGVIEAFEDGVKMGELTYEWISDEKLLIDHTQVSEKFKGMGIARKLVIAAIDEKHVSERSAARKKQFKVKLRALSHISHIDKAGLNQLV